MNDRTVEALVLDRLAASAVADSVGDLVIAALLGDDELAAAVECGGTSIPARPTATADGSGVPAATYLKSVTVEGVRGIGPRQALRVAPGPGLTLVMGRNGSGKSSFAEAVELAMTGDSKRWSGRTSVVWRDGWRNLHEPTPCRIGVELAVDGVPGATTLVREWAPDADLDEATSYVQPHGKPRTTADDMNWSKPLEVHRPFLSYDELGALIDGRPSDMYDAVQAILGLDQLVDAERRLNATRKRLDDSAKSARRTLDPLLIRLHEHPDERANAAASTLTGRTWDLDQAEALATGAEPDDQGLTTRLRQVASIELAERAQVTQAVAALRDAHACCAALTGTPAADARRLADLLTTALAHHQQHPGEDCPVCGGRSLDGAWAEKTRTEVERLRAIAYEADEAQRTLDAAHRALRGMATAAPYILTADLGPDVDPTPTRLAWQRWAATANESDLATLAAGFEAAYGDLNVTVTDLRDSATAALRRREESWQPLAAELAGWLAGARVAVRDEVTLKRVKQAIDWLKTAGQEIRDLRLAPFAAMSAKVWEALRQESNVDLGPIRLEGSATRRRLALDVTVDDVPSVALGVMSQGELHALGLALFLPRATATDSPFRFVIIDDPVQSMDPAKVDGLARMLADVAQRRQVVVFTHDDRLAESIRRLQLPATVWGVLRRPGSVVEIVKADDPVSCYLDDARALARTQELSETARAIVVAGLCRAAIEAACHEVIRARRLGRGIPHADVERDLAAAQTLHQVVTLCVLDDMNDGGQLVPQLNKKIGWWAGDAFLAVKHGAHTPYTGDISNLIDEVTKLTRKLRR